MLLPIAYQVLFGNSPSPIVQQASSASTVTTIVLPGDITAGDILVILDHADALDPGPTLVTPTGWTSIDDRTVSGGGNTWRQNLSFKPAEGNEGFSTITGMSGDSKLKVLVTFRPNVSANTLTPSVGFGTASTGNPAAQTITSSEGVHPLIVLAGYGARDDVDPRTFTVNGLADKDDERNSVNDSTTANRVWLAWKIYNEVPADVVFDMDDEGSGNMLTGGYIEVA